MLEHEPGWEVCGVAANGREAVALAIELTPDIIIVDMTMPELDGVQTIRQIKRALPNLAFASPVSFSSAAVNDGTGSVESATGSGTNTVTINLTGVTDAQRMTLALFDVDDTVNRGDVGLFFRVLVGDTSGNGFVNSGDTMQTRLHSGETTDSTNFRSDVNANGFVNSGDTIIVPARSGNAVQ